jgi:enamine deaminase RidA (YjgF/YER057c/UK114 family)
VNNRINISSGSTWEDIVGYSRVVRVGNIVEVAGTVAVKDSQIVAPGDAYEQSRFILEKVIAYLAKAGAGPDNIVRTRIFTTDISRWQEIGRAHLEIFRDIKPVSTMVEVARLIEPDLVVEIEATAILSGD